MALTYVRWIERITGQLALRSEAGKRLMQGTLGLVVGDKLVEGARQAVRAGWVGDTDTGPAEDALGLAGGEVSLPRYPSETAEQYHARLQRAWEDWQYAGHESSIIGQLEAAGFPGAEIYYASDWPTSGLVDWWSQFWVFYPAGTHTVTAPGPDIGGFTVGDGTTLGPVGISPANLLAMRSIIKKFKPTHWICSGLIFEISAWTMGAGPLIGDPGLLVGGEVATVGVP